MYRPSIFLLSMALAGAWLVATGTSAHALSPLAPGLSATEPPGELLVSFDENGNAIMTVDGGSPTTLTGTLMVDPADPSGPLGLTYLLPESVLTGDVDIFDPDGALSDALRFTDASGDISGDAAGAGARMIYYSDLVPDPGDLLQLADTGFPSNLNSDNFVIGPTEIVGPTGSSFDYQPAGLPFPQNNEYIGVSDVAVLVPEPASLALLGSGMTMLGVIVRRRRR
jgi:hypothetical protein